MQSFRFDVMTHSTDNAGESFVPGMFRDTRAFQFTGGKGALEISMASLGRAGLRFGKVVSTGHEVALAELDNVSMLFPQAGRIEVQSNGAIFSARPGEGLFFRPNMRRTRVMCREHGMFEAFVVLLPEMQAVTLTEEAPLATKGSLWMAPSGKILAERNLARRRLNAFLRLMVDEFALEQGPPLSKRAGDTMGIMLEELVTPLLQGLPGDAEGNFSHDIPFQKVRAAEDIMRARSDEALSVVDIARDVGVGLRSLQLAFQKLRGMGPRDVLNDIRLQRARLLLTKPKEGDTVTSIALDCGFSHLGRFSQAYRRAFGESPSETLRGTGFEG